jgi:hypothetical protein
MDAADRRKHARVATSNLISYESIDKDDKIVSNSMGRALNVSRSGILLEISHLIEAEYVYLRTFDLDNNLIKIKGQLIYCRKTDSGWYQAGIRFVGSEQQTAKFAVKLIKLYQYRKHNMTVQVVA